MDYQAIIATAIERSAYGAPDADGMPSGQTQADVAAILALLGEPEEEQAVSYAFDPEEPRDESGEWAGGGAARKKRTRPAPLPRGKEGVLALGSRLAAAGIGIDPARVLPSYGEVAFEAGPKKAADLATVAQFDPLGGRVNFIDSPHLSEKEKMEYAAHELVHALDHKLGPAPFKTASDDPESELGKMASAALQSAPLRAQLQSLGYREHQLRQEALAYLGSRWARQQMGAGAPEDAVLDALLPALDAVLKKHAGTAEGQVAYESHRAPAGKPTTVGNKTYMPGEFVPAEQVETASPEEQAALDVERSLPEKIKHAPKAIKAALSPESIDKAIESILDGVKHPAATAGKAKDAAKAKLKAIYAKYGAAGTAAVAAAYVAYYAVAIANPVMFTVPVPLTATILTCAELVRRGGKAVKDKLGYSRDVLAQFDDALAVLRRARRDAIASIERQDREAALYARQQDEARAAEEERLQAEAASIAEEAALYARRKAEEDEASLAAAIAKATADRGELLAGLLAGLRGAIADEVKKAVPPPVVGVTLEKDAEGRTVRVLRKHRDGSTSVQTVRRD